MRKNTIIFHLLFLTTKSCQVLHPLFFVIPEEYPLSQAGSGYYVIPAFAGMTISGIIQLKNIF